MKTYEEMQAQKYKTSSDRLFHKNNKHLLYIDINQEFEHVFTDAGGTKSTANTPNFFNPLTSTYIVLCNAPLNKHEYKKNADEALNTALRFAKTDKLKAQAYQCHNWYNSIYQYKIIGDYLENQGYKLLILFSDTTKFTTGSQNDYKTMVRTNIHWLLMQQYNTLLCA